MQNSKSKKDLAFEQERVKFRRHIRSLENEIRELKVLLNDVEFQTAKYASLNSSLMDDMFKLKEFIGLSEEEIKYILGYMSYEIELDKLRDVASLYPYQFHNKAMMMGDFGFFGHPTYGVKPLRSDVKVELSVGPSTASGPDYKGNINIGTVSPGRKNFAQRIREGLNE